MPTQLANDSSNQASDIKVKIAYNGEVLIFYIEEQTTYDELCKEIRGICRFALDQVFTMKWIDEENDPCTISTQMELYEAIRLYEVNRDSELFIHVFPNAPSAPGMSCIGEDRSIYRRGARRWRKLYRINGHIFQVSLESGEVTSFWALIKLLFVLGVCYVTYSTCSTVDFMYERDHKQIHFGLC